MPRRGVLEHRAFGLGSRILLLFGFLCGMLGPVQASAREAESELTEECGERGEKLEALQTRTATREHERRVQRDPGSASRLEAVRPPQRTAMPSRSGFVDRRLHLFRRIAPPDEDDDAND